jgi:hypothetical protein
MMATQHQLLHQCGCAVFYSNTITCAWFNRTITTIHHPWWGS